MVTPTSSCSLLSWAKLIFGALCLNIVIMSKVALVQDESSLSSSSLSSRATVACESSVVVVQRSGSSDTLSQMTNHNNNTATTAERTPSTINHHTMMVDTTTSTTSAQSSSRPPSNRQNLSLPIIVVGYPKSGTSSVFSMFVCGGFLSSHYCCGGGGGGGGDDKTSEHRTHFPCRVAGNGTSNSNEEEEEESDDDEDDNDGTCSSCIQRNQRKGLPILEGCGDYDVYAQLDAEQTVWLAQPPGRRQKIVHLPQHFELEQLHAYAPQATFVLNLRPPLDWAKSLHHWFGYADRFLETFQFNFTDTTYRKKNLALMDIYHNHTAIIREFVRWHPSHTLLEVDITDPASGQALAQQFGIDPTCWGHHNKNWKKGGASNKNATNTTTGMTTATTTTTIRVEGKKE